MDVYLYLPHCGSGGGIYVAAFLGMDGALPVAMVNDAGMLSFDVVVVGGGAAGVAAAVGAARSGASVCIIEQYGFLGGAATNSSVLTHCGFFDQSRDQVVKGVGQQFLDKLDERRLFQLHTFEQTGNTVVLLDLETTKSAFDDLILSSGVTLFLHSQLISASVEDGLITGVEIAHRGGHETIAGRAFVDASGDGALIAASGAAQLLSDVTERQASTLVMRVGGVGEGADLSEKGMASAIEAYEADTSTKLLRTGSIVVRLPVTGELMLLLADQHLDVLDVEQITAAEVQARELNWAYLSAFKRYLDGWSDAYLTATGPQIGIRESRRLKGKDSVSASDVTQARKRLEDAIARCGWPMENHVTPGVIENYSIEGKGWYHIPYGAICSASTENLWAGGRLISSDSRAYASLRVMGTAFATGHAAGVGAAVYAEVGHHDYKRVRQLLEEQGALI